MSEPINPQPGAPLHAFQVLSKTYAGPDSRSWSQTGSADLTAAEAHAWISVQLEAVLAAGLAEIPTAAEALAADTAPEPPAVDAAPAAADVQAPTVGPLAGQLLTPGQ